MGYSQSNHIGFYIVFDESETTTIQYEETRCTNTECPNHTKEMKEGVKFCPDCGSKVDWLDVEDEEVKTFNDYTDDPKNPFNYEDGELYDWFWSPEYIDMALGENYNSVDLGENDIIIIPNRPFKIKGGIDASEDIEMLDEFKSHPATAELLNRLGKYEIHFGLVQYQS